MPDEAQLELMSRTMFAAVHGIVLFGGLKRSSRCRRGRRRSGSTISSASPAPASSRRRGRKVLRTGRAVTALAVDCFATPAMTPQMNYEMSLRGGAADEAYIVPSRHHAPETTVQWPKPEDGRLGAVHFASDMTEVRPIHTEDDYKAALEECAACGMPIPAPRSMIGWMCSPSSSMIMRIGAGRPRRSIRSGPSRSA
jgi:hypothetical protein